MNCFLKSLFQVDMGSRPQEVTTSTSGFDNPVHEMSDREPGSESKPGTKKAAGKGASCMIDSDDEDAKYFKDGSA